MATPMPETEIPMKRVLVWAPTGLGYLMNLVAEYQFRARSDLYDEIFKAGLHAYLGLSEEDVKDLTPTPLRFGAVPPEDPKELVDKLIGRA